jgi:probable rRNA maturation factor
LAEAGVDRTLALRGLESQMERSGSQAAMADRRGEAGVDVVDADRRLPAAESRWLADMAGQALTVLGVSGEVRVRIVGDGEMARAHGQYAGEGGTTDVLTFDLRGEAARTTHDLDTDILVCFDEASRQASARGHAVSRELLLYIVHGVLHCLGHDDHDPAAAARMHAEEDRVLAALGVGPVYARKEVRP